MEDNKIHEGTLRAALAAAQSTVVMGSPNERNITAAILSLLGPANDQWQRLPDSVEWSHMRAGFGVPKNGAPFRALAHGVLSGDIQILDHRKKAKADRFEVTRADYEDRILSMKRALDSEAILAHSEARVELARLEKELAERFPEG